MLIPQPSYRVFSGLPPKTHWAPAGVSRRGPRGFWLPSLRGSRPRGGPGPGRRAKAQDAPRRSARDGRGNGPDMRGKPRVFWGDSAWYRKGVCSGLLYVGGRRATLPHPVGCVHRRASLSLGFGMDQASHWPWPPQIFSYTVRRWGLPACGGLGTGQRTRICRCFVLWPDNAHCRLVSFAGGRCGPTARGWNVSVAFRPLVPVGSTPRGASTSGLSTTCSAWGLQELEGSTECLSLEQVSNQMLSAVIPSECQPAVPLATKRHTRGSSTRVLLVLWAGLLSIPTSAG